MFTSNLKLNTIVALLFFKISPITQSVLSPGDIGYTEVPATNNGPPDYKVLMMLIRYYTLFHSY